MGSQLGKTHQLSAGSLREVRREMESSGMMSESLDEIFQCAEEHFTKEPDCVKNNAKMTLHWNGKSLVFVSGRGVCEINVSYKQGSEKPSYNVTSHSLNIFLGRISAGLRVLSLANLEGARRSLDVWEETPKSLKTCFDCAIRGFRKEPACVQENAKLVIHCSRRNLPFISGKGECEISVSYSDGKPVYTVDEPTGEVYLARLGTCPAPLNVSSVVRARNKLESFGVMTQELRGCFEYALEALEEAPKRVQENALMLLDTTRGRMMFKSGKGEITITVFSMNGEFTHDVKMPKTNRPPRK
ncbi:uncharacterized protein LOC120394628 [Mauremys reevesii]|uniref:uncharacterized protein LOC120392489 n=1 Tax=Mauremys reevesii TaxID=260615 RepID=UPI00193F7B51|nr:uncharacterized protein LOC120392489 [Mauremys reevesii]XP_039373211.1 uncharacterized protein LOC120392489 [Mauremys reevesii]XP_039373212.1 uncharacterized protein LOC120392489 [Mauremys reevesii]XP_039373213.1 uncharacterized protein LOC120392489 [Mauremys reevesii]XP_039373214.1 uncharacterized protein LOC120392489 [Mauremys reevesii]XP_039374800.1 uncharacterized protein LOC120394628 [Mauremys reevesii]XP_039374801.1 uncharacterized protein LOC120394628 [Mauremys reevesii]XP_03937480